MRHAPLEGSTDSPKDPASHGRARGLRSRYKLPAKWAIANVMAAEAQREEVTMTRRLACALTIPLLAVPLAGCASQRFAAPVPQVLPQAQATPQQPRSGERRDLGGPYTRGKEDTEFGGRP